MVIQVITSGLLTLLPDLFLAVAVHLIMVLTLISAYSLLVVFGQFIHWRLGHLIANEVNAFTLLVGLINKCFLTLSHSTSIRLLRRALIILALVLKVNIQIAYLTMICCIRVYLIGWFVDFKQIRIARCDISCIVIIAQQIFLTCGFIVFTIYIFAQLLVHFLCCNVSLQHLLYRFLLVEAYSSHTGIGNRVHVLLLYVYWIGLLMFNTATECILWSIRIDSLLCLGLLGFDYVDIIVHQVIIILLSTISISWLDKMRTFYVHTLPSLSLIHILAALVIRGVNIVGRHTSTTHYAQSTILTILHAYSFVTVLIVHVCSWILLWSVVEDLFIETDINTVELLFVANSVCTWLRWMWKACWGSNICVFKLQFHLLVIMLKVGYVFLEFFVS